MSAWTLVFLSGCAPQEPAGSPAEDSTLPDTTDADGDGLTAAEEAELGTDPDAADSDGDGYSDGGEVHAGTDPLDDADVIYTGGWPYNPDKDALGSPDWGSATGEGAQVPRLIAVDQYGEEVDLYDFAGQGRHVMLDMGTPWCEPCKDLAAYLSTGDTSHLIWRTDKKTGEGEFYPWWKESYEGLAEHVAAGDVYWITILFSESSELGLEDAEEWHDAFPNPAIPVLIDADLALHGWIGVTSYPVLNLLDENMTVVAYDDGGPFTGLTALEEVLSGQ